MLNCSHIGSEHTPKHSKKKYQQSNKMLHTTKAYSLKAKRNMKMLYRDLCMKKSSGFILATFHFCMHKYWQHRPHATTNLGCFASKVYPANVDSKGGTLQLNFHAKSFANNRKELIAISAEHQCWFLRQI